jgi:hypothetical protein
MWTAAILGGGRARGYRNPTTAGTPGSGSCLTFTRRIRCSAHGAPVDRANLDIVDLRENVPMTAGTTDAFGSPGRSLGNVDTPAEYSDLEAFEEHLL